MLLTDAEWAELPEDDEGELVDGVLSEEEDVGWTHETVVVWLVCALHAWGHPRGAHVAASGLKYLLRPGLGRRPDASLILPGRKAPPAHGALRNPPDVMIEVVAGTPRDGRRDRIEKAIDYAAFGVSAYWIIDPQERTLEVLRLGSDGRYVAAILATGGAVRPIEGEDELVLDLDALWAELDALSAEE